VVGDEEVMGGRKDQSPRRSFALPNRSNAQKRGQNHPNPQKNALPAAHPTKTCVLRARYNKT
jgi:hypothetical protein